jgi:hypothetical protein
MAGTFNCAIDNSGNAGVATILRAPSGVSEAAVRTSSAYNYSISNANGASNFVGSYYRAGYNKVDTQWAVNQWHARFNTSGVDSDSVTSVTLNLSVSSGTSDRNPLKIHGINWTYFASNNYGLRGTDPSNYKAPSAFNNLLFTITPTSTFLYGNTYTMSATGTTAAKSWIVKGSGAWTYVVGCDDAYINGGFPTPSATNQFYPTTEVQDYSASLAYLTVVTSASSGGTTYTASPSDTLKTVDSVTQSSVNNVRNGTDQLKLVDSVTTFSVNNVRNNAEQLKTKDAATTNVLLNSAGVDQLKTSDSTSTSVTLIRYANQNLIFGDSAHVANQLSTTNESIKLSDVANANAIAVRQGSDKIIAADSANATITFIRNSALTLIVSDNSAVSINRNATTSETLKLNDSSFSNMQLTRNSFDFTKLKDTVTANIAQYRVVNDSIMLSENVIGRIGLIPDFDFDMPFISWNFAEPVTAWGANQIGKPE